MVQTVYIESGTGRPYKNSVIGRYHFHGANSVHGSGTGRLYKNSVLGRYHFHGANSLHGNGTGRPYKNGVLGRYHFMVQSVYMEVVPADRTKIV